MKTRNLLPRILFLSHTHIHFIYCLLSYYCVWVRVLVRPHPSDVSKGPSGIQQKLECARQLSTALFSWLCNTWQASCRQPISQLRYKMFYRPYIQKWSQIFYCSCVRLYAINCILIYLYEKILLTELGE